MLGGRPTIVHEPVGALAGNGGGQCIDEPVDGHAQALHQIRAEHDQQANLLKHDDGEDSESQEATPGTADVGGLFS